MSCARNPHLPPPERPAAGARAGAAGAVSTPARKRGAPAPACGAHPDPAAASGPPQAPARQIALVGNPNTGKSALFHALTGIYVEVSNYPGTTVDVPRGRLGEAVLLDTPGVYGISSFNEEERITREAVLQADAAIAVLDALHLERSLFLALQLADLGVPMVVALNLVDEAAARGLEVDAAALAEALGVPVVPTVAVTGRGVAALRAALADARPGRADPELERRLPGPAPAGAARRRAVLALDEDPREREQVYARRHARAEAIARAVVRRRGPARAGAPRHLLLRPLTGLPVLALVLAALYWFLGVALAQTLVSFTEEAIMEDRYQPLVRAAIGLLFPPGSLPYEVLGGEFGVLTMAVTYALGLLLPLVAGFYLAMAVLEDSGYLPRLAVLADRLLTAMGLNGRAVIPLVLGLGCVTMATLTTRILGTRRERLIATALLALAVPCSAQMAVIAALLAPLGFRYLAVYAATILLVLGLAGHLLHRLLPGRPTSLFLDLPPLRWPRPANLLKKTWARTAHFVREAFPLFVLGSLLVTALRVTGALAGLEALLAPITAGWLGLPPAAARAFLMGMLRRDFGAAGLYALSLTPLQALTATVTITLFVPCLASLLMIFRERGRLEGLLIWAGTLAAAFLLGGLAARAFLLLGL